MEFNYPFTYEFYIKLINLLKEHNYVFSDYMDCNNSNKTVILRHDIDNSIDKALELAEVEAGQGVKSTYFVLLTSPFYNIFQKNNREKIKKIKSLGHDIGLHFDEENYDDSEMRFGIENLIYNEITAMESALDIKVFSVSMHRPSKKTLESEYEFDRVINSYGKKFFKEYKYLSDSRRRWREDIVNVIKSGEYTKIHLLTHAFWYNSNNISLRESVESFIRKAGYERYDSYKDNFTNLEDIIERDEL